MAPLGDSQPAMGIKKRGGSLESCLALDLNRREVDHAPPQLDHQTVHGDQLEVLLSHLRWVTGPGAVAEVGQWHGAFVPVLTAALGFPAAFHHHAMRPKVAQGVHQGRRVSFFVAVAQQPSCFHHSIARVLPMVSDEAGRQPKSLPPRDGAGAGAKGGCPASRSQSTSHRKICSSRAGFQPLLPQDLAPAAWTAAAWPP